jgi:hypothetical protein
MSDPHHSHSRKCVDLDKVPVDIANALLDNRQAAALKLADDCSLPWARRAASDLQKQEAEEDKKLPADSYVRWDHARFRTPKVLEEKAHLFQTRARQELIELASQEIVKILQQREAKEPRT